MHPTRYLPPAEQPNEEYPIWLTTGRLVWHWHTRTKTGRSPYLQMAAQHGYVEINKEDAKTLSIVQGEVVKISSPRGWIEVPARVGDVVQKGLVFVPFHFGSWQKKEAAKELTADFVDPLSKQPTFKQSACKIEKIRREHKIETGETLEFIAEQYGLTADGLIEANRLQNPYSIQMGDTLEIPLSIINVPIQPYMPYRQKI
ncbi:molybdopterin dinucleotide binding domain-containing protein [Bacillus sp. MUM 13]|uniref:molybdopterin dinucleotide binding domain-containing protein n=1 Tax=Bacillus sp. MUM 13 TaxID=1678001 RepID=UPI001F0A8254|nr:molybdopterin dinucleotide binding domain-containing protein [Bacillus sp. MUM 13]